MIYPALIHPMINVRRIVLAETAKDYCCPADLVKHCASICGVSEFEVKMVLNSAFNLRKMQAKKYLSEFGWNNSK